MHRRKLSFIGVLVSLAGVLLILAVAGLESSPFSTKEPTMATLEHPLVHPDGPTRYALFAAG